jgi:1-acyl-sn-glycerol-3-phosphate acyltransferase
MPVSPEKTRPLLLRLVYLFFRTALRLISSIRVIGLDRIPRTGPVIIAANHISNVDPPALLSSIGLVRLPYIMTKKELFRWPFGWFFLRWGGIPVDRKREGGDLGALRGAVSALKDGGCLAIFPEGTRAKGRDLKPKLGVALMAHKSGAPVLPVRLFNTDKFLKLGKITVKYGSLRYFEPPADGDMKAAYAKFSEDVMTDIFSITEEQQPHGN